MRHIALIFIDGVGIGEDDASKNPFVKAKLPTLKRLCDGIIPTKPFNHISSKHAEVIALDANLGVEGLPQSGTNQVTIFAGVNGPKRFGRHFGPYPPSSLRPILMEKNVFSCLRKAGKSVVFANAFPKQYFEYLKSGAKKYSVSTLCCKYANITLLTEKELLQNKAISSDLTREAWKNLGYVDIKRVKPKEAGKHFFNIAINNDFSVFEYWLPDYIGHSRVMSRAVEILERFDEFVGGFLDSDMGDVLLMIISDHGNIEDINVKTHTCNKVPCIIVGEKRKIIADKIKSLVDVTPNILRYLKV